MSWKLHQHSSYGHENQGNNNCQKLFLMSLMFAQFLTSCDLCLAVPIGNTEAGHCKLKPQTFECSNTPQVWLAWLWTVAYANFSVAICNPPWFVDVHRMDVLTHQTCIWRSWIVWLVWGCVWISMSWVGIMQQLWTHPDMMGSIHPVKNQNNSARELIHDSSGRKKSRSSRGNRFCHTTWRQKFIFW